MRNLLMWCCVLGMIFVLYPARRKASPFRAGI